MNSLFIAQPPGRTTDKSLICSCGWHRITNVLPMSVRFHRWTLGFRQSSFNHIAQALQSHNLHVFHYSPLHIHALVPFLFRVQVSCSPRRHCPERRPPLVVILLVRTTAHTLTSSGSSYDWPLPSVPLTVADVYLWRFCGGDNEHGGVASCGSHLFHLWI